MSAPFFITRRSVAAWLALGAAALPLSSLAASPADVPEKGRTVRTVLGLAAGGAPPSQATCVPPQPGAGPQTPGRLPNPPDAGRFLRPHRDGSLNGPG